VAISEARSIPGCAKLAFLLPIGGDASESRLFGGVGRLDRQKQPY
jgi:hypothetical protein